MGKERVGVRGAGMITGTLLLKRVADALWKPSGLSELLIGIVDFLDEMTGADAVLVFIHSGAINELELKACSPAWHSLPGAVSLKAGEGLPGWAAFKHEVVVIERDARSHERFSSIPGLPNDVCESFVGLPMEMHGRLAGVIALYFGKPLEFGKVDIDMARAFARLAAGAVDSAIMAEDSSREAEMLSRLSGAVASSSYIDEILQLIVSMTAEIMQSKICSLMLLDEGNNELTIAATQSLSSIYRNKGGVKVGQSASGQVVRDRKAMRIRDVQSDPRYAYPEIAAREGLRSLLSVPMMIKDRILGVINLYTAEIHDFTEGEVRLLQTVASQAAVAIDNTRLLSETTRMQEALETRKLVERAKGIIMDEMGMSEDGAFRLIQKRSMDTCRPLKEIAKLLILASEGKDGEARRGRK